MQANISCGCHRLVLSCTPRSFPFQAFPFHLSLVIPSQLLSFPFHNSHWRYAVIYFPLSLHLFHTFSFFLPFPPFVFCPSSSPFCSFPSFPTYPLSYLDLPSSFRCRFLSFLFPSPLLPFPSLLLNFSFPGKGGMDIGMLPVFSG